MLSRWMKLDELSNLLAIGRAMESGRISVEQAQVAISELGQLDAPVKTNSRTREYALAV